MPTKQPTSSSAESRRGSQSSRRTEVRRRASGTNESDEQYALISVLYHALQGAETCGFYVEDARRAGDQELTAFFEETREEQAERADRAKQLLAARLEATPPDADDEEEDDEPEEEEDDDDE